MAILGQAQFTITDLHDAIIKGTPPDSPAVGALWIDTSVTPNILKSWNGTAWVDQTMDLDGIDPTAGASVTSSATTLSNLADDSKITQSERSYIKDKVSAVVGYTIGDTATMPTIATIDAGGAGDAYSVRRQAVLAGLVTTNASYIDVATQYTSLATYMNAMTPLPWNTTDTGTNTIVPSDWRDKWAKYYEAVYNLQELIANQASINAANAQAAAEGYADLTQQYSIRYIRDWLNGSTSNTSNHWVEIMAMAGTTNRALSAAVTSNATLSNGARVTDGDTNTSNWTGTSTSGLQYVQIDLGAVYQDINYIQVWHYNADGRTYHNTKTEISSNGVDWTPLFDSAQTGEYAETSTGRTILVNAGNAVSQAQGDATSAKQSISDMSNDNLLTPSEKSDLQKEWNIIQGEKTYVDGMADTYSITTEKTAYDNAYNTLNSYIPPFLTSLTTNSTIVGTTYRSNFSDYYNAKAALLKKVQDSAKAYADTTAQLTASGLASSMTINNGQSTYFPFNENLLATSGLNPGSGTVVSLRNREGRFGGAAAIEEGATNLLANPGFETGDITGWTPNNMYSDTIAPSVVAGELSPYMLKLEGDATNGGTAQVWQTLTLTKGASYTYSSWIKFDTPLVPAYAGLYYENHYNNFNGTSLVSDGAANSILTCSGADWSQVQVGFNIYATNNASINETTDNIGTVQAINTSVSPAQITLSKILATGTYTNYRIKHSDESVYHDPLENGLDTTKIGVWQYGTYTFTAPTHSWYTNTQILLRGNSGVGQPWRMYIDNTQLEQRSFASSFVTGTRADGKLTYTLPSLPSDHTLMSYRKSVLDSAYVHWGLTKSGSTFNYYENGVVTTTYKNKWVAYEMANAATSVGYNFANYTKPIAKQYFSDFSPPSHNLSTQKWGWYMKTYVYSTAAVTVWHRYSADNNGSIRVNNGTMQNMGGWMNPAVNSTNPDVRIDLVSGWNLVEICYMDGDTGGGLSLQKNSGGSNLTGADSGAGFSTSVPLSQVPQIIYMTAELPVEFSSNTVYFNEKSNILIDEMMISSRIFTGTEISGIYGSNTFFDDPVPRVNVPAPSSVTMTLS